MPDLARLLGLLLLVCLSSLAQAERLRLVSDDWAPYIYQENGQPKGIDYEVSREVFKRLSIEVDWQFLPWKRCLAMVEQGQVDGVLDIFQIDTRKSYMIYPDEPLSNVEFVVFRKRAQRPLITHLHDLAGLTVGISPGYAYGPHFNESPLFKREAAPTHEANFGKLMLGRIDALVTDRQVGRFLRHQLGLLQQVEEQPLLISRHAQYLGLAQKPGRQKLAQAFADELRQFKREPAYAAISARYAGDAERFDDAIEQQERGTLR